jgi:hypothetical protein
MKTMQAATDKAQESKREAQQQDTYRAPRLVTLGTAVGLVQGSRNASTSMGTSRVTQIYATKVSTIWH